MKLALASVFGPVYAPDTTRFLGLADLLAGISADVPPSWGSPALYGVYAGLIAVLREVTGSTRAALEWLLYVQVGASALSVPVLYGALMQLSGARTRFSLCLSLAYLFNPDVLMWDRVLTADSLNLSLLVMTGGLIARRLSGDNRARTPRAFAFLMLLILALALCRPTNVVFLGFSLLALLGEDGTSPGVVRIGATCLAVIFLLVGAGLLRYGIVGRTPIAEGLLKYTQDGVVFHDRPSYDTGRSWAWNDGTARQRLAFILRVFAKRALYFWAPVLEGYSWRHTMLNVALIVPLWAGALAAGLRLFLQGRLAVVDWYLVSLIAGYNLFHAATVIDFDMRYRIVVMPFMLALIARGFRSDPTPAARV